MTKRELIKKPKFILQGINTYLPYPISYFLPKHETQFEGKGARTAERQYKTMTEYARSSYGNWMRVLVNMHKNGIDGPFDSVAELGPGDTIGTGICAFLSGADTFSALDVVPSIVMSKYSNMEMLEELITLFRNRETIPDEIELPKNRPTLDSYEFPTEVLTEEILGKSLNEDRLNKLRVLIEKFEENRCSVSHEELNIYYLVPWSDQNLIDEYKKTIDLIVSFATMEHVDDVYSVYSNQSKLLKDDGVIAHAMDFKCHHTAGLWNGHWTYSDIVWRIIWGRCAYLINRWPHSWHIKAISDFFTVVDQEIRVGENQLKRSDLAKRFKNITDSDLENQEAYILAKKSNKK